MTDLLPSNCLPQTFDTVRLTEQLLKKKSLISCVAIEKINAIWFIYFCFYEIFIVCIPNKMTFQRSFFLLLPKLCHHYVAWGGEGQANDDTKWDREERVGALKCSKKDDIIHVWTLLNTQCTSDIISISVFHKQIPLFLVTLATWWSDCMIAPYLVWTRATNSSY